MFLGSSTGEKKQGEGEEGKQNEITQEGDNAIISYQKNTVIHGN